MEEIPKTPASPAVRMTRLQLAKMEEIPPEEQGNKSPIGDDVEECQTSPVKGHNRVQSDDFSLPNYDGAADTKTKLAVVKEPPKRNDEMVEDDAPDSAQPCLESQEASEAVKKLESLFQPIPLPTQRDEGKPVNDMMAMASVNSPTLNLHTVEPMTALDKAIENVNEAVNDIHPSSAQPKKDNKGPNKTPGVSRKPVPTKFASGRPSVATKGHPTALQSNVQASASVSSPRSAKMTPSQEAGVAKVKQRSAITALHTPPALVKSSKPLTKSNFQLPGEAVTAKFKAQREERLRKEEGEALKKKEFKPRPAPKFAKPVEVKPTAASRARMSIATSDATRENANDAGRAGTGKPLWRASMMSAASTDGIRAHRSSTLAMRNRNGLRDSVSTTISTITDLHTGKSDAKLTINSKRPDPSSNFAASTSRSTAHVAHAVHPRARSVSMATTYAPFDPSTTLKSTLPSNFIAQHRLKIREGFMLQRAAKQEQERLETLARVEKELTVKERCDAARKARMEAAERGRLASREWAEKRKTGETTKKGRLSGEKIEKVEELTSRVLSWSVDMREPEGAIR